MNIRTFFYAFTLIASVIFSCSTNNSDKEKRTEDGIQTKRSDTTEIINTHPDSAERIQVKLDTPAIAVKPNQVTKVKPRKTIDGIKVVKILSESVSEGKFEEIEIGDYGHFNITKLDGTFESYFIIYKDDRIDKGFAYGKYDGRKVKVYWQKVEAIIEQSGPGVQTIEVITKVELQ